MSYGYNGSEQARHGFSLFFNYLIRNLLPLMLLNIVFLLCCLPVITLPVAVVSMNSSIWMLVEDENRGIIHRFFKTFRKEFFRSIPLCVFFFSCQAGALYGAWFYYVLSGGTGAIIILAFLCLIIFLLFYMASMYVFPMLAVAHVPLRKMIKNSFVLVFMYPGKTMGTAIISLALLFIGIWLYPSSIPILAIILFALVSFINVFGVSEIIKKHILI